ncbi:hypothetical protein [Aquimarina intermedia]|uniref:Uncharacterized protein n=1 Tax=Aquimarina intermedia TaxID=350814 RepID=A0A5S5C6I1_9FLAO|nr:hypothetical protein [Aquimarina intermedia]TYP73583.1 hypothetical protein BD809_105171 [Aquimarina intermedia]
MNKEQLDSWKINIFNSLRDLSDLELQKLAWTGKHPFYVSSFVDSINTLYDDNSFKKYIDYIKVNESNKSQLPSRIIELDKMIDNYMEEDKSDLEILDDPNWFNITKTAKSIIDIWVTN